MAGVVEPENINPEEILNDPDVSDSLSNAATQAREAEEASARGDSIEYNRLRNEKFESLKRSVLNAFKVMGKTDQEVAELSDSFDLFSTDVDSVKGKTTQEAVDIERASAQRNPAAYKQLSQFMSNVTNNITINVRSAGTSSVKSALDEFQAAQKSFDAKVRDYADGKTTEFPDETEKNNASAKLSDAIDNDANLKEKVESNVKNSVFTKGNLFKFLAYATAFGLGLYGVLRFLQWLAQQLSGCYMQTSDSSGKINEQKLDRPDGTKGNDKYCNCAGSACTLKDPTSSETKCCSGDQNNFVYCVNGQPSFRKWCNQDSTSTDFVNYTFKELSPFDIPGMLLPFLAPLLGAPSAIADILKYLIPILIVIGVVILLVIFVPMIIKAFHK